MAEYIKREATIKAIVDSRNRYYNSASNQYLVGRCDGLDIAAGLLRVAPAADVAPVVHTRWAHLGGDEWCCPVCGFVITTEGSWDKPTKKYCEDCGAKMDGGADNGGIQNLL